MKQITKEEKASFITRPMRKQSIIRTMLLNMKVGDIYFIESQEWKWTSATPAFLCRRIEKDTDYKFECEKALQPKTGWIVERTA
ncbi:MAG: hypothetical protein AB7G44_01755 [Bacteroidia bacterium]